MDKSKAIKEIRERLALSQTELAKLVGVSFATVNRWENGRFEPSPVALKALKQVFEEHLVDFSAYEGNTCRKGEGSVTLYLGTGEPWREDTLRKKDKAFSGELLLTEDKKNAYRLAGEKEKGRVCTLRLDLHELSVIDVTVNLDWTLLLAKESGRLSSAALCEKYEKLIEGYDLAVGYDIPGGLEATLERFFNEEITDTALLQSICALSPARRYVALSEKAYGAINLVDEKVLDKNEKERIFREGQIEYAKEKAIIDSVCRKYRRDGLFFDELIEKE